MINHVTEIVKTNFDNLLPEEILILLKMLHKIKDQESIVKSIEQYVQSNLADMSYNEVAKVFMNCELNAKDLMTPAFVHTVKGYLFDKLGSC